MDTDSVRSVIEDAVQHAETDSVKANIYKKWSSDENAEGLMYTKSIAIPKREMRDSLLKESSILQPSFDKILKADMEVTSNYGEVMNISNLSLLAERNAEWKRILLDSYETKHVAMPDSNKEDKDGLSITLYTSTIRPSFPLREKLLILDINGVLADVVSPPPKDCTADKTIARRAIFKRPFCLEFLRFCFERFGVGVWSSRTKKNVDRVINYLMGDMRCKLLFCWDQSHCTASKIGTLENKHKPIVFKELHRVWEKCEPNLPWEKGYYNKSNTLLLDDSPYKALLNPPHTAVFPYSYKYQDRRDNSLGDGGDLRFYLEGLYIAENVQKYVEQQPFGQRAISEKSESWPFYCQVIDTINFFPGTR
ncbi:NIF domain-containing protein [Cephalotus follicularis]|uniref:Mitochondrial import inner membrane translocase subunit TIM50 n=1 Tax=Cephalotus follicularis TaxID=3775 RepID=A0A1Q3CV41_CEPFO|nr:NIF domain-containing protein [Cephalotus follicularis]